MKNIVILIYFLFNISCFSQTSSYGGSNTEMRINPVLTTNCMQDIEKARVDFNNNKFSYLPHSHGRWSKVFSEKLKKHKIIEKEAVHENIEYEEGSLVVKDFGCYREFMEYLLKKKFGNNFFDKLKTESDSLYVMKHLDDVYDFSEFNTWLISYPNAKSVKTQFEDIKNDLNRIIMYPVDFKYKNEEGFSYTSADFIINIDGSATIKRIYSKFQNKENEKYKDYFEQKLKEFVLNSKWIPATLYGHKVKTAFDASIQYR